MALEALPAVLGFPLPVVIQLTIGLPVTMDASLLPITGVVRENIDNLIIGENLPTLQENIGTLQVVTDANYHLPRLPVISDETLLHPVTIVNQGVSNIPLSIIVVIRPWESFDEDLHLQVCTPPHNVTIMLISQITEDLLTIVMCDESEICHLQLVRDIVLKHTVAIHKISQLPVVIPMRVAVSGIKRGKER